MLYVGLFYLSRFFEKEFLSKVNKGKEFINFVVFQRYSAFWQSLKFLIQL